jgi:hypothetical protein
MEITISSDVFGLSSTKNLCRNAVLHPGDDVMMMWWLCHLISRWGVGLNTSDLTQRSGLITCIASDLCHAHQKYSCTVWSIIGLRQGHLWSQNDVITPWLSLADTLTTASCIHLRHTQRFWAHLYVGLGHMAAAFNSLTGKGLHQGPFYYGARHKWDNITARTNWECSEKVTRTFKNSYIGIVDLLP